MPNRFIVINSRSDDIEQMIIYSHELRHDQLHRSQARTGLMKDYHIYDATNVCEREANYFASQLLIDDTDFGDCAEMKYTYAMIAAELHVHNVLPKNF